MFGENPIRPPEKGDGSQLKVVEIFPTLQGEGPYVGQSAVFVRLGGCNLACDFCDTEFEDFQEMTVEDIVGRVRDAMKGDLVVLTGGEPLRQPITPLCRALLAAGWRVQIETNGTLWRRDMPEAVHVVCSPKPGASGYAPLREDLLERAAALKFIVSAGREGYREVAEVGQSAHGIPVYVQPMDEYDPDKNRTNLLHARDLALENGYRLSLQLHKVVGLP